MTPAPGDMPAYGMHTLRTLFGQVATLVPAISAALRPLASTITERSAAFDVPFAYQGDTHRINVSATLVDFGTPAARYQITVIAKNNLRAFRREGMVATVNEILKDVPGFQAGIVHLDGGNTIGFSISVVNTEHRSHNALKRHLTTALEDVLADVVMGYAGIFTYDFHTVVDYTIRRRDNLWSVRHDPHYESGKVTGYAVRVTYAASTIDPEQEKVLMSLAARLLCEAGYHVTRTGDRDVWATYWLPRAFTPTNDSA